MEPDDADSNPTLGRRAFIGATVGTVASMATTGAGTATAQQSEPDYDGWFTSNARGGETKNFDGTVDMTGQDEVTIEVGAQGNDGPYAFGPAAVEISPGTTVVFEWTSDTHNILVESQPDGANWEGHEPIENTGFELEHTFETEGIYKYLCEPHLTLGMKGAIVVSQQGGGESSGGGAVGEPDYGDWFTAEGRGGETTSYDETVDRRGEDTVTVEVGADGNGGPYAFTPTAVRVDPGTTVVFEWVSDTHNILVDSQPDDANWEGYEPIENTGFELEHTFKTEGVYKYFCQPHLTLGMKGAIVVGDIGGEPAGDEGGESGFSLDVTLTPELSLFGGSLLIAFLVPLIFATLLFREKSGTVLPDDTDGSAGVGYGAPGRQAVLETSTPVVEESEPFEEVEREIGHDEYDPVGTATLIVVYFLILIVLWVFMYFIEFLGNGPTVIG
ncbi:MAG: halocyanin domain-containing protein [Halobacteriales archaeon]